MFNYESEFRFADAPEDLLTNLGYLEEASRVILWVGIGLAEQLLLAWFVFVFDHLGYDIGRLRVVQIAREPRKNFEVHSLGMLNPQQLRELYRPRKLILDELQGLRMVWRAVTSSSPDPLLALLEDSAILGGERHRALASLLKRYPAADSGLGHWDALLLRYVREHGPSAVRVVGHTMADDLDSPDWAGDWFLFSRLRRLGDSYLAYPLLEISGDSRDFRTAQVRLTEYGERVLAGTAHFVELNGIDDWVAGVHLRSAASHVWFYRDGKLIKGGISS